MNVNATRSASKNRIKRAAAANFGRNDAVKLPETGFVRLHSILGPRGPIPVSRSTWLAGVKSGRFPAPVKLGPRITAWWVEDIRALIASRVSQRVELKIKASRVKFHRHASQRDAAERAIRALWPNGPPLASLKVITAEINLWLKGQNASQVSEDTVSRVLRSPRQS